jgi:hypothetical protein
MISILFWFILPIIVISILVPLAKRVNDPFDAFYGFLALFGIFYILCISAVITCTHINYASLESERTALVDTRKTARQYTPYENVAITSKIMEFNRILAKDQYYAGFQLLDIFYPDYILDIKPIR